MGPDRDVVKETFEVDGRAAVTIKTLFRHPGKLTCEFLAGRRRMYTSPLRLYLVISISFFVLVAWLAGSGILLIRARTRLLTPPFRRDSWPTICRA